MKAVSKGAAQATILGHPAPFDTVSLRPSTSSGQAQPTQDAANLMTLEPDELLLAPPGIEPTGLETFCTISTPGGQRWIGKYPVTNRQFARFIEDNGYDRPEFWSEDGWAWRNGANPGVETIADEELRKLYEDWLSNRPAEQRREPYYWDSYKWNSPLYPVVGVSWYEAQAYARWLTAQLPTVDNVEVTNKQALAVRNKVAAGELEIRLPLEMEWEAAMGGQGDFVWRNKF